MEYWWADLLRLKRLNKIFIQFQHSPIDLANKMRYCYIVNRTTTYSAFLKGGCNYEYK